MTKICVAIRLAKDWTRMGGIYFRLSPSIKERKKSKNLKHDPLLFKNRNGWLEPFYKNAVFKNFAKLSQTPALWSLFNTVTTVTATTVDTTVFQKPNLTKLTKTAFFPMVTRIYDPSDAAKSYVSKKIPRN